MSQTHSFSIYLLKSGFGADNSVKNVDRLLVPDNPGKIPSGAKLFVLDAPPHPPWWKDFWGIDLQLSQASKGALIILPIEERNFALCFGHVSHYLRDESYEYDFGIRVTLNALDPEKIKSTDLVEPASAKRQRIQSPVEAGLGNFDFDRDTNVVKSLTGKVKEEYKELFKHATGSSNLRLSSNISPEEIVELCKTLLTLYKKNDFQNVLQYQDILNVVPVKDPTKIIKLDEKLIAAFKAKASELMLTIPDLVNYEEEPSIRFAGGGDGLTYDDISMLRFYEYLESHQINIESFDITSLDGYRLVTCNEDGDRSKSYKIYDAIIFDTKLDDPHSSFHLCDGNWYEVNGEFVKKISDYLDKFFKDSIFPEYEHENEEEYNKGVSEAHKEYICLDRTDIAPMGQKQVEPCDLYTVNEEKSVYCHVKVSTRSSLLSHLFSQGSGSINLIRGEEESRRKLKNLIMEKINGNDLGRYLAPIDQGKEKIVYIIATKKNQDGKSGNLPLLSKISLYKAIKHLRLLRSEVEISYIQDKTVGKEGKPKVRKKRNGKKGVKESE
jgi:uncharacterized protein (TIGR04141 family)